MFLTTHSVFEQLLLYDERVERREPGEERSTVPWELGRPGTAPV